VEMEFGLGEAADEFDDLSHISSVAGWNYD
jgi:hypothetical protein